MQDKQKFQEEAQSIKPSSPRPAQIVFSQFVSQYKSRGKKKNSEVHAVPQILEKYLTLDQLTRRSFWKEIELQIVSESTNKQIVYLKAKWGSSVTLVKIINIRGLSQGLGIYHDQGNYGSIFLGEYKKQKFVIKCLPLNKTSRKNAIKQFVLLKMCSELKIGPNIKKEYIGFDMLMFQDCCAFAMERCEEIKQNNFNSDQLFQTMNILHELHVVHQDIKPENIMYSSTMNRLVFIDFGLSTVIEEDIGQKTLTPYVGTLTYCSQEMKKLISPTDQKNISGLVDLYYNDLVALERSIASIRQGIQNPKIDPFNILDCQIQSHIPFLSEVRLKYCLFENCNFATFMFHWNEALVQLQEPTDRDMQSEGVSAQKMKKMYSSLLEFIEELTPRKQSSKLFFSIIPNIFDGTELYQRVKIMYQISQKALLKKQVFHNKEKNDYFLEMCQQIPARWPESQPIINVVIDKLMGTIVSDLQYLSYYLQYISYINNKHRVTAKERIQAAQAYYRLFNNQEAPSDLAGRSIVEYTILHCLKYLLRYSKVSQLKYVIATFLFRILDFLSIMDIGTSEEYIAYLQQIFSHWSFDTFHRMIFLMRVRQLNTFNNYRVNSKSDVSRLQFINLIGEYLIQKWDQNNFDSVTYTDGPQQFQNQFMKQTLQFQIISKKYKQFSRSKYIEQMVDLYYINQHGCHHTKILLNYAQLFKYSFEHNETDRFCKHIVSTFKDNFQDDELMSQFSLEVFVKKWAQKTMQTPTTVADIIQLNNFTLSVETKDVLLLAELLKPINYNLRCVYQEKHDYHVPISYYDFIYKGNGFMNRLFLSGQLYFQRQISKSPKYHKCKYIKHFLFNFMIGEFFIEDKTNQVCELIQTEIPKLGQKCQNCQLFLTNTVKMKQLKGAINQIQLRPFDNPNLLSSSQFQVFKQQQYVQEIHKLFQQALLTFSKLQYLDELDKSLLILWIEPVAILCFHSEQLQGFLHGFLAYYQILIDRYDLMEAYFTIRIRKINLLACITYHYPNLFISFVLKIASFIETTKQNEQTLFFTFDFRCVLEYIFPEQQQKIKLFQTFQLVKHHSNYMILFYCELLLKIDDLKCKKKIFKKICQMIDKIHFQFKRMITFQIIQFHLSCCSQGKPSHYFSHHKNSIVKLAMIDNRTEPIKRRFKKSNKYMSLLFEKIRYYEKYFNRLDRLWYKFTIVKKGRKKK